MNEEKKRNFIEAIIEKHVQENTYDGQVVTRFPPEPNGYLHIGHAKSILLNFGLAQQYGDKGRFHLRFDDTNPEKEDMEFVESIQKDIRWLGADWKNHMFFASDYFGTMYDLAVQMIEDGKAYVCSLTEEEIRTYRGTVTEEGQPSPYRSRSVEENLQLFEAMKQGQHEDGSHVLRAKIDMANPNMKMRDPLMYRIRKVHHFRTGREWNIYPFYDWAHCVSDAIEGITHSICTLEFENNRELYDWFLDNVRREWFPQPRQYEFAKLKLNYTIMGKRKLIQLVHEGHVNGWDDPRMMTIAGLRRRGYTPESLQELTERVGVAKADNIVDFSFLEFCIRNDLNFKAPRLMAVLEPLKVTITNWKDGATDTLQGDLFPHDVPKEGTRTIPFAKELWIEQSDFMENPTPKYFRLAPGQEVRLRHAYIIRCNEIIRDQEGHVVELKCTYDPDTLGKNPEDRKVKGVIHWVPVQSALPAEFRLYERLFLDENPDAHPEGFIASLNPDSLKTLRGFVEPAITQVTNETHFQFERTGFFVQDIDSTAKNIILNRTVSLKDSWNKNQDSDTTNETAEASKIQPVQNAPKEKEYSKEEETQIQSIVTRFSIRPEQAEILFFNPEHLSFFKRSVSFVESTEELAKWIVNELLRVTKEKSFAELALTPKTFGELVNLVTNEEINSNLARKVFEEMLSSSASPTEIIESKGWKTLSSSAEILPIVEKVFSAFPEEVQRFRNGETKLKGFLVGQAMKESKGSADPQALQTILLEKLQS